MNLRKVWTEIFQKPAGRLILFLIIGGIFLAFVLLLPLGATPVISTPPSLGV